MDTLYSITLLFSLVTGSGAVLLAVSALARGRGHARDSERRGVPALRALVPASVAIAVVGLVVSVTAHVTRGHAPGTPDALAPLAFLQVHPSFLIAGALPLAAFVLHRLGRPSSGGSGR